MALSQRLNVSRSIGFIAALILLTALFCLNSCSGRNSDSTIKVGRILMGTLIEVTVLGPANQLQEGANAALDEIKRIEDLTSFHKESKLNEINKNAGIQPVKVDPELLALIQRSLEISSLTDGAFDPTIGVLSRLWNFSGTAGPRLPDQEEINAALKKVGWKKVQIFPEKNEIFLPEKDMALDLGGIAKGYALNRAEQIIKSRGLKFALINAGGDIAALGGKGLGVPWKIGIQDPRNPDTIAAVVQIDSGNVFTSGDYERFFDKDGIRYHHILDPVTGYPASGLDSVTIVAPDGTDAEGLSAAVFVLGSEKGMRLIEQQANISGLIVDSEGRYILSSNASSLIQIKH